MEARFIEGNDGTLVRFRNQARYTHPFRQGSKVAWIAYDELLVHLNGTRLRAKGVDHNRIFGGLQIRGVAVRTGRGGLSESVSAGPPRRGRQDESHPVDRARDQLLSPTTGDPLANASAPRRAISFGDMSSTCVAIDHLWPNGSVSLA